MLSEFFPPEGNVQERYGHTNTISLWQLTIMSNNKRLIHKFDFDIGYLIKSPCKGCKNRNHFPSCADDCEMLDKIQRRLIGCVSSTRSYSAIDTYALSDQGWTSK